HAACCQHQMRRAKQRFQIHFKAEERVPYQIEDSSEGENERTKQGQPVTTRQRLLPCVTFPKITACDHNQYQSTEAEHAVEYGVPGCKERVVNSSVRMCPTIQIEAAYQQRGQDRHHPVEGQ